MTKYLHECCNDHLRKHAHNSLTWNFLLLFLQIIMNIYLKMCTATGCFSLRTFFNVTGSLSKAHRIQKIVTSSFVEDYKTVYTMSQNGTHLPCLSLYVDARFTPRPEGKHLPTSRVCMCAYSSLASTPQTCSAWLNLPEVRDSHWYSSGGHWGTQANTPLQGTCTRWWTQLSIMTY